MTEIELRIVGTVLYRGKQAERLSDGVCLIACLGLLMAAPSLRWVLVTTVLLGLVSKYYAIRVALDAHLFELMAGQVDRLSDSTASLDRVLMPNAQTSPSRPWTDRAKGAYRLLIGQVVLVVVQLLVFTGGAVMVRW